MAETRIPGRNGSATVISDSYGTTIISGPPEPLEQPRAEDQKLDQQGVGKKFGWTAPQTEAAIARPDFPVARERARPGLFRFAFVWSEEALDKWAAEQRALAAEITALLGR